MKISQNTLDVLKNFSSINTNFMVRQGNVLATKATAGTVFARATVAEDFPREFGIYDLNSFLALVSLMDDTDIVFNEDSLTIGNDDGEFHYYYADTNIIVAPPAGQSIPVDDVVFNFKLSRKQLDMILRAAAITSAPAVSIVSEEGKVRLVVGDPETPNSNAFRLTVGECDRNFTAQMKCEQLKMVVNDYNVSVCGNNVVYFENSDATYQMWIALQNVEGF